MQHKKPASSMTFFQRLFNNQLFLLSLYIVALMTLTAITMPAQAGVNKSRFIIKYRSGELSLAEKDSSSVKRGQMALHQTAAAHNVQIGATQQLSNGAEAIVVVDSFNTEELIKELNSHPDIEYIEPDNILTAKLIPNDTLFNEQWHYFEAGGGINLPEAWNITLGIPQVVVAVIDTGVVQIRDSEGILSLHPDLVGQILPGYDFISDPARSNDGDGRDADASDSGDFLAVDECAPGFPSSPRNSSWHGTHVAGTIAANTNDGFGVAGVAGNTKILPVRVLGKCGGLISDIAEAVRWSAGLSVVGVPNNPNPAKVINMSLGGTAGCSRTMQEAITAARAAGTTIVVAAGNEAQDAMGSEPANCSGVVAVASNSRDGGRAPYSNFGLIVDVAAPGGVLPLNGVLSTFNAGRQSADPEGHNFQLLQGTSMASPHVAGVAALMLSIKSDLSPGQVESLLKTTSRAFPEEVTRPCIKSACGEGIVDAGAVLKAIQAGQIPDEVPDPKFENTENIEIPAGNQSFAVSELKVNREGPSNFMRAELNIKHINAADLKVTLFAPTGDFLIVKDFGGEVTQNFSSRFVMNAGSIPANGTWSLRVEDNQIRPNGSAGFIDEWSLEFFE